MNVTFPAQAHWFDWNPASQDLQEKGYTKRPIPLDFEIAAAYADLAKAAWDLPKDIYYTTGTRLRTLNRYKAVAEARAFLRFNET